MTTSNLFRAGKYEIHMTNDGRRVLSADKPNPKRGLVFYGSADKGRIFFLDAKCRNTDKATVIKCTVKALLTEMRENLRENSSIAVKKSYNEQKKYVSGVLSCCNVVVTNNEGKFITESTLSMRGQTLNEKLGDIINIDKKESNMDSLYSLVVRMGKAWDDPMVIQAMKWFVAASIQHIDYMTQLNRGLEDAASSTEKEEDAEDKKLKDLLAANEAKEAAKAAKTTRTTKKAVAA